MFELLRSRKPWNNTAARKVVHEPPTHPSRATPRHATLRTVRYLVTQTREVRAMHAAASEFLRLHGGRGDEALPALPPRRTPKQLPKVQGMDVATGWDATTRTLPSWGPLSAWHGSDLVDDVDARDVSMIDIVRKYVATHKPRPSLAIGAAGGAGCWVAECATSPLQLLFISHNAPDDVLGPLESTYLPECSRSPSSRIHSCTCAPAAMCPWGVPSSSKAR